MNEVDMRSSVSIYVGFIVVRIFDGFNSLDDFSYVHSSRVCVSVQVVIQQLKLLAQISGILNLLVKSNRLLL